jgi:hypothetical protein
VSGNERDVYADAAMIIGSALVDDPDGVAGTLDEVRDSAGERGVLDVAVCLAATMVGADAEHGMWALDFPDIDGAGYDARWVARFVSAYLNADPSTVQALFGAARADGLLPDCLLALAGSTAATLRRRADG